MTHTPTYTGVGDGREVGPARHVAERLLERHRDLGYGLLFSAAAYLIRDGQKPTESRVVTEAKRRRKLQELACQRMRRRRRKEAA